MTLTIKALPNEFKLLTQINIIDFMERTVER